MPFTRNRTSGQPFPVDRLRNIPGPQGESAQEASTVYEGFYGDMPIPAPQFVPLSHMLYGHLKSPSVRTVASNASVVDRVDRRNGIDYTGGRQSRRDEGPQMYNPVRSSGWQQWLIGPQVNYILNDCWYIAYPAATISWGTTRNLGLSQKVPQLPTRTSGGPGPAAMMASPRFKSTQTIPRYSTMPSMYNTQSTQT